jgi:D-threo-aldose 1-dehydrogenase
MTGLGKRPLGRSSVQVTVLGLGTATLGGHRVHVTREDGEAIVGAAWAAGVRYFDTAPFYGFGQAERCTGDTLRAVPRSEWVLSTKVGRLLRPRASSAAPNGFHHPLPFDPVFDYSYDGIIRGFEDSLQRLGLAQIDMLYVHDVGTRQHGQGAHPEVMRNFRSSGYRALDELRRAGLVQAIGIGVNEHEVLLEAMDWGAWVVFLLAGRYTLLEQEPITTLLPRCLQSGVSIVVGAPLNTGALAGRDSWSYRPLPPEIAARVNSLKAVCDSHGVPLVAAALQFPLAHPAVASVIPGPRNVEELTANLNFFRFPIPAALWSDLRAEGLLHPDAPTPE